jgi:hypothetical protein
VPSSSEQQFLLKHRGGDGESAVDVFHLATSQLAHFLMAYGYFPWENVYRLTRPVGLVMIVLGLLIIASRVFVHCNERRVEEEAEYAFPGPLDASSPVS